MTALPTRRFTMPAERTFLAIKPDGVQRGLVGEILGRCERKGFMVVALVWEGDGVIAATALVIFKPLAAAVSPLQPPGGEAQAGLGEERQVNGAEPTCLLKIQEAMISVKRHRKLSHFRHRKSIRDSAQL